MRKLNIREALNEVLREEMRKQPELILLGQDIGSYGGTFGVYRGLFEEFGPERVRDGPLCESATVGFAIGLAMRGMRCVVELEFMDFTTVAMDQIVNQAAKLHYFLGGQVTVPLVIRTPIVSRMGMGPQHSQSLESWFMHVPGLKIAIPSNAHDAAGLLRTTLRGKDPVLFIENVKLYGAACDVPDEEHSIPFGQARTLREGTDVTIVAISGTVPDALAAATLAAQSGIEVEVIDPRTLNPLDDAAIAASLRKTGRLIIAHDAYRTCGVAAEISQRMMETAFDYLNAPIMRVTGLDVPVPSGALYQNVVPSCDGLLKAIGSMVNG
jgi:pyruvate/2-oxoglutarate/acetoin dehydrogenase E1 component